MKKDNEIGNFGGYELILALTYLNCNDLRTNTAPNYIYIYIYCLLQLQTVKLLTLESSFNQFNQEVAINEINCSNCSVTGNHYQVSNITYTTQYLYIQLQLWNDSQEKINKITFTSLPRTALNIDGKT